MGCHRAHRHYRKGRRRRGSCRHRLKQNHRMATAKSVVCRYPITYSPTPTKTNGNLLRTMQLHGVIEASRQAEKCLLMCRVPYLKLARIETREKAEDLKELNDNQDDNNSDNDNDGVQEDVEKLFVTRGAM